MASRMERYYRAANPKRRSQLNQDLYRDIYEDGEYSNIEGVAMIDKNNEIDITKVKRMLKNREDYKRQKEYRNLITKKEEPALDTSNDFLEEETKKTYDIMDVLREAKEGNDEDDRYLQLDNTNYNILKELKIEKEKGKNENQEEELKELINTITNTSMLNKLDDEQLSLKLLEDLQGETKVLNKTSEINSKLDNSFYTTSIKLNSEDFEDSNGIQKKKFPLKIVIIISVAILVLALILFIIMKLK